MEYIVDGTEMSKIDNYTIEKIGIPQMVLMERAALAVAGYVEKKFDNNTKILVVAEGGNNGGDGIAAARILTMDGYDVEVFYINSIKKVSGAFSSQLDIAKKVGVRFVDEIRDREYKVVIDGIFGVGLSREVTGAQADAIRLMNGMKAYKIAIDMPSGINSDTGEILGDAFRADITITFGLMKRGAVSGNGKEYCGNVYVADIGFPVQAIDEVSPRLYTYDYADFDRLLPKRKPDSHKGNYGKIGIIAGAKNMAGAALFTAEAAYRIGGGLVKICTVEENREIIQTKLPEAMLETYNVNDAEQIKEAVAGICSWSDVIAMGPGLGTEKSSESIVIEVLKCFDGPVVLDADGINILAQNKKMLDSIRSKLIITPHLMEMSRLTGNKVDEIKCSKYETAVSFAKERKAVVVLKDSDTMVSDGSPQAYINITGNAGMAKGGSGDVLTGIIAGLIGQGMDMYEAAKLGCFIHGSSGDEAAKSKGCYSMIARDILKSITKVLEGGCYVD